MKLTIASAAAALGLLAAPAFAGPTTLWAVDATATGGDTTSTAYAEQFSLTGALLQRVSLGTGFNPTGIAIVGNTAYVTSENGGQIRTFNTGTGAAGATYSTGQNALGALATDGASLFAADLTGGNRVYRYSLTGGFLGSFVLSGCGSYCNGLEYANGALISNRGQQVGPYDRYSTAGALQASNVFSAGDNGALAYNPDTRTYLVAASGGQGGYVTSPGNTSVTFGGSIPNTGFGTSDRFFNDFAIQVPEPTTLALTVTGLGLLGLRRRRA